ncbi:MAG: hypothetical protein ACI8R9_000274 [Paraglaciecola sp.]|jgi:hypothetical protein
MGVLTETSKVHKAIMLILFPQMSKTKTSVSFSGKTARNAHEFDLYKQNRDIKKPGKPTDSPGLFYCSDIMRRLRSG